MPAMPRTSKKAREIAYNILGCPGCLEEEEGKKTSKKQTENTRVESPEFKLDSTLGSKIP
jgi:hypothetical protein